MRLSVCGIVWLLGLFATTVHGAESSWRLVKDEDGIKVYLQAVEGSKYKAYRGVTTIKAPLEKLIAMQEDVSAACEWIHSCKKQSLLKQQGNQSWMYSLFETPWPVQPRDAVFFVDTQYEAAGAVVRELTSMAGYLPDQPGIVRVPAAKGFCRMVPTEAGVEITYQMHSEPGGSVPAWLANDFVVDAPFNTLRAWRRLAEQRP